MNAEKSATFQSINLHANAGEVQANLQNATIAGDVSLNTQAGTVNFGVASSDSSRQPNSYFAFKYWLSRNGHNSNQNIAGKPQV